MTEFPRRLTGDEILAKGRAIWAELGENYPTSTYETRLQMHEFMLRCWVDREGKLRQPRYEWRVRYRRATWVSDQTRIVQRRSTADRLVAKLTTPRSDLSPLVLLRVERRLVQQAWTIDDELIDGADGEVVR